MNFPEAYSFQQEEGQTLFSITLGEHRNGYGGHHQVHRTPHDSERPIAIANIGALDPESAKSVRIERAALRRDLIDVQSAPIALGCMAAYAWKLQDSRTAQRCDWR